MTVIAIIAALLLEQWRPLGGLKAWFAVLDDMAARLERAFNAEQGSQGLIAWLVGVGPAFALAIAVHSLLRLASPLLSLLFDIAVLYLTLGFRQFSHSFTAIQTALKAGDVERASELPCRRAQIRDPHQQNTWWMSFRGDIELAFPSAFVYVWQVEDHATWNRVKLGAFAFNRLQTVRMIVPTTIMSLLPTLSESSPTGTSAMNLPKAYMEIAKLTIV